MRAALSKFEPSGEDSSHAPAGIQLTVADLPLSKMTTGSKMRIANEFTCSDSQVFL